MLKLQSPLISKCVRGQCSQHVAQTCLALLPGAKNSAAAGATAVRQCISVCQVRPAHATIQSSGKLTNDSATDTLINQCAG